MDVNFSLASHTPVVGAEARTSFIQWDMEEDVHSYSVGWWENEVISKREHSPVKSSIAATALYHCNYIFQMQMIALRILPLVHRLQEQFSLYFSAGDKSHQRLRTGESHPLRLFSFPWRCFVGRNSAESCEGASSPNNILLAKLLLLLLIRGERPVCSRTGRLEPWQRGDLQSLTVEGCCSVVLSHSVFQTPKKYGSALDLILLLFFEVEKCRLCQIWEVGKA